MSSKESSSRSYDNIEESATHDLENEARELASGEIADSAIQDPENASSSYSNENFMSQTSTEISTDPQVNIEEHSGGNDDFTRFVRRSFPPERKYRRWNVDDDSSDDEENVHVFIGELPPPPLRPPMGNPIHTESLDSEMALPAELLFSCSSSSDSSMSLFDDSQSKIGSDNPTPKVLLKPKPCHKWFAVKEIITREAGLNGRGQGRERFQHRYYGSLHAVQRMELMYKLERHRGCVNSLHFNRSGELLVSTSDDKHVVLWDWAIDKSILSYNSGHMGNVFQAKFLPLTGDKHIVTCARDGQVRLGVLSSVGVCKETTLLAEHKQAIHKLAIHADTPHVFLSAGEDGLVLSHDVRTNKCNRVLLCKEGGRKVSLFSIDNNPMFSNEFIVTGDDHYVRLYDKRKVRQSVPVKKYTPKHLIPPNSQKKPDFLLHVTCAVFNYNGTEVLASYNDDDIYLFDTRAPDGTDYAHKYGGHRNSVTVKGVNFFGPKSEFIVSGSDCGNIFFWEKSTESIVQWMRGDEEGVVNCLQPNPRVPILATSGLDHDIKIWIPSCEKEPTLEGLKCVVLNNLADREQNVFQSSDPFDNRQMRWLWSQIQRFEGQRSTSAGQDEGNNIDSTTLSSPMRHEDTSSSSEGEGDRPQCSPS